MVAMRREPARNLRTRSHARGHMLDVLIVDDDVCSRETLAAWIGHQGMSCRAAADLADARAAVAENAPDLALLRRRDDFYASELPGPEDILLIVEVADSSLARDRGVKLRLYARTGVREVWLVDLQHQAVEVHRQPRRGRYRLVSTLRPGQRVAPLAFPDRELDVTDFLG